MSQRPHGYARYRLDKCRCDTCRAACSAYNRRTTMAKTAGTWQPFVDAAPVREHLEKLAAAGIGLRRAAQLAGLERKYLQAITNGVRGRRPSTKVRPKTAAAILAVQAEQLGQAALAAGQIIEGPGTARRIQALAAIGWSLSEQARRIGWSVQNYDRLVAGRPVTVATARLVAGLYDELSMTPAPAGYSATRARRHAESKGFAPPLAWDDDHIDNPQARPSGWEGQPRPARRETLDEFLSRYQPLAGQGLSWAEIAEKLDVTVYAAKSRIRKAKQNGLLEQVPGTRPARRSAPSVAGRNTPARRRAAPCGTRAAYVRHQRRGEPVDAACAAANRSYQRKYARDAYRQDAWAVTA